MEHANPPSGDRADVKVPDGLRELYDDCIADDSRCSRTTTSGFTAHLIERIAKLEAANKSLLARAEAAEAAVAWTPIGSEHLPKVGDEVGAWVRGIDEECPKTWTTLTVLPFMLERSWIDLKWTHFRARMPPADARQKGTEHEQG